MAAHDAVFLHTAWRKIMSFVNETWILDSGFLELYSGFQSSGFQTPRANFPIFRILQAIISRTQESLTGSETWSFFLSTDKDECLGNPCKNGATCMNIPRSYRCKCTSAYTGRNCEKGQDRGDMIFAS